MPAKKLGYSRFIGKKRNFNFSLIYNAFRQNNQENSFFQHVFFSFVEAKWLVLWGVNFYLAEGSENFAGK